MKPSSAKSAGFVSGLLQSGYATGYLAASLVFGFLYALLGWRGMFMVGIVPAFFLIFYIWRVVEESPAHETSRATAIKLPMLALQVAGIFVPAGYLTYLLALHHPAFRASAGTASRRFCRWPRSSPIGLALCAQALAAAAVRHRA